MRVVFLLDRILQGTHASASTVFDVVDQGFILIGNMRVLQHLNCGLAHNCAIDKGSAGENEQQGRGLADDGIGNRTAVEKCEVVPHGRDNGAYPESLSLVAGAAAISGQRCIGRF